MDADISEFRRQKIGAHGPDFHFLPISGDKSEVVADAYTESARVIACDRCIFVVAGLEATLGKAVVRRCWCSSRRQW